MQVNSYVGGAACPMHGDGALYLDTVKRAHPLVLTAMHALVYSRQETVSASYVMICLQIALLVEHILMFGKS